ncbi:MAG TPA: helix-turn-helix transcriptional regulator [Candidatus Nanopelagicales bacterium]|nr:helix-turn-helix transcriptional regulator [Candidatus Nanopelagicales bacterium]
MKRLPEATLQAIGAEVRRRREAAGMSMVELGERAELSHQYISRLELGQVDFSVSVLFSIAEALKCSVADLLPGGEGGALPPDVMATARLLADSDPEFRNALHTMLSRLPSGRPRKRSGG